MHGGGGGLQPLRPGLQSLRGRCLQPLRRRVQSLRGCRLQPLRYVQSLRGAECPQPVQDTLVAALNAAREIH